MYHQINPTETFRERHLALQKEAEDRPLLRRLRAGRRIPKESSLMRRTILLLSTMAAGLMLASGVALAASTVVSETFSNSSEIQILDPAATEEAAVADPYPSKITVSGFNQGRIRDVNLKLRRLTHAFPDDVGVLVVGPDGQSALVMSDVGTREPVSAMNLTLDDEAANSLPDGTQLSAGRFKPTQGTSPQGQGDPVPAAFPFPAPAGPYGSSLSVFDGTDPNGTWKLYVLDDSEIDEGRIEGSWSLRIRAKVPV